VQASTLSANPLRSAPCCQGPPLRSLPASRLPPHLPHRAAVRAAPLLPPRPTQYRMRCESDICHQLSRTLRRFFTLFTAPPPTPSPPQVRHPCRAGSIGQRTLVHLHSIPFPLVLNFKPFFSVSLNPSWSLFFRLTPLILYRIQVRSAAWKSSEEEEEWSGGWLGVAEALWELAEAHMIVARPWFTRPARKLRYNDNPKGWTFLTLEGVQSM